jgi:hypothetical protein
MRSCEDVDETALSYAEIKALCAGDPRIREKMELDNDVARLRLLKSEYDSQHYGLEDSLLKRYPQDIAVVEARITGIEGDIAAYKARKEKCVTVTMTSGAASVTTKFPGMTINGITYAEKEPAGKALIEACKRVTEKGDTPVGEYMGFKLSIRLERFSEQFSLLLRGNMTYSIDLGTDTFGNITRINNALDSLDKRLEGQRAQLENLNSQVAAAKAELANPFPQEQELIDKETRLVLLNTDLNIDEPNFPGDGGMDVLNDAESRDDVDNEQNDDDSPADTDRPTTRESPLGQRINREYGGTEPRTGTYGKAAPTFLDNIRNLGNRKRESQPPSAGKSSGIAI